MNKHTFFCAGTTPAIQSARTYLEKSGILLSKEPDWNTRNILLDIPSFRPGQEQYTETLLSSLPPHMMIWGGNLNHPALEGYCCQDLLQDKQYLLENASITADCTIGIIAPLLKQPWSETTILILGWGRIAKFLARLLSDRGCRLFIAARKQTDLLQIKALGYFPVELSALNAVLPRVNVIVNTVPAMIVPDSPEYIAKIDLASKNGIAGDDVIRARGLPGIHAPERSGKLIANTILRILREETV